MDRIWELFLYLMTVGLSYGHLPIIELLENQETNNLYCLLRNETESTAIMWENGQNENTEVSQYRPNLFHCEIGKDEKCTKLLTTDVWKSDDSLNYDLGVVLDRRWETFKIIKTPKISFQILHTPGISSIDFTVDVYVKVRANAFIFLCDGQVPPDSKCYWITLAGWNGKESVIRKCGRGTIPSYEGIYPQEDCRVKRAINYHNYTNQPTSAKEWRLITTTIKDYTITVASRNQTILTYADPDKNIEIRHILVASLMDSPGEWKINNGTNIYRTGEPYLVHKFYKPTVQFGFSVKRTNVVNNVFVYLCEGDNVFNSTCYKVVFNDNGRNTVCKIGSGASFHNCEHSTYTLWKDFGKVTYWHHFTFTKNKKAFTFYQLGYKNIVEFNDSGFSLRYVFIGSEKMVYWKIHSYGVVAANRRGNTTLPLIQAKKDEDVCIAVFVQKTPGCNLTMSLTDGKSTNLKSVALLEENIWKELQLKTKIEEDATLFLNVSLKSDRHYAFISDIRDCNENDRILELNITGLDKGTLSCVSTRYPELKAKVKKEFLKNATIIMRSSNIVDLTWARSRLDRYYTLKYYLFKYIGCKHNLQSIDIITNNITPTFFGALLNTRVSDLTPYAVYSISLSNHIDNVIITQTVQTWSQDEIEQEELPLVDYEQEEFKLDVLLTITDCKLIRGPLFYKITITGLDSWINNSEINQVIRPISVGTVRHSFHILGFSTYNVSLEYSRSVGFITNIQEDIILHTHPTASFAVSNVTVYSKTNTSVWVRWKEPFPPTGKLEKYVVQYLDEDNYREDVEVPRDAQCKIWPDYICVKIEKLTPHNNYTIHVRAKNDNVDNLGKFKATVYALTEEELPYPPKHYTISWNDLFMIIEWEHPDVTNGPLKYFYVTINGMVFIYPIEEDFRFYTTTIDARNFSARVLNVTLKVSNLSGTSIPLTAKIASPPKTPKISGNRTFQIVEEGVLLDPITLADLDGISEIFVFVSNQTYQRPDFNCSTLKHTDVPLYAKLGQSRSADFTQKLNITLEERGVSNKYLQMVVAVVRNSFGSLYRCSSHKFSLRLEQGALISMVILLTAVLCMVLIATGIIVHRCSQFRFRRSWNCSTG